MRAGAISVAVRIGKKAGDLILYATAQGLKTASVKITIE
jgi:hypothetical protein